jgi:hypothetical protein
MHPHLHASGPNLLAAMHNSGSFAAAAAAAAAAGAMAAAAPVDSASAPIPAVHPGAYTSFVPLLGAVQGWHLSGAGPQQQESWPAAQAAGFSANLPPIRSSSVSVSNSAELPVLTAPHQGMLSASAAAAAAAAAAAGFSAPMPRLASLPGRLPAACGPNSLAGNSQPLPAAMCTGLLFPSSQTAGAGAQQQQQQHIPCLHVDEIDLLLQEDGSDIPDLEAFLAAGGNLLQDDAHTSGQQLSSGQHAPLLTYSQHSSGQHAMQMHPPASVHTPEQAAASSAQAACATAAAMRQAAAAAAAEGSVTPARAAVQGLFEAGRGSGVPSGLQVPDGWAQLPPACPPAGPAGAGAAAAAAAAAVNVFGRRPGNSTQQYRPGRSSLDMFTGVLAHGQSTASSAGEPVCAAIKGSSGLRLAVCVCLLPPV